MLWAPALTVQCCCVQALNTPEVGQRVVASASARRCAPRRLRPRAERRLGWRRPDARPRPGIWSSGRCCMHQAQLQRTGAPRVAALTKRQALETLLILQVREGLGIAMDLMDEQPEAGSRLVLAVAAWSSNVGWLRLRRPLHSAADCTFVPGCLMVGRNPPGVWQPPPLPQVSSWGRPCCQGPRRIAGCTTVKLLVKRQSCVAEWRMTVREAKQTDDRR